MAARPNLTVNDKLFRQIAMYFNTSDFSAYNKFDLTKIHTKQLMAWRAKAYKMLGKVYDPYNKGCGPFLKLEDILKELEKRPHVPNKKEARAIRQNKAKLKH